MPKPREDETKKEYMKRCMSDNEMERKYPDLGKRYKMCLIFWEEE